MAQQATGQPYQQYTAPLVAGMNQNQQQAISNVQNAQGMALPFIQQGAQYTNQAAQGVNPGMINQFMSPYLNTVVGATQKNLLESNAQQQAAMKSGSIQSGAFGGDRAKYGLSELARQQGLAGGQVIGGLMNQGYGQALGAAQNQIGNMMMGGQQLAGMGTAAQQSALGGAQALMAAGTQQQSTEQAGLQAAYDQFLQRQAYPYQQAQFYANIAQGIGAGAGGSSSTTQPGPSPFSQVLGFGTAMAGLPWSDERLKENVKKVGQTKDGQGIYTYNFKGNPKTEMGLLAQEVEKKHPDAVHEINGLKMVDYDAATEGSRTGKAGGGASMGGLVAPGMERQAFAAGGFGAIPYADFMKGLSYIPATDMSGAKPGSTLPSDWSNPPKPFEDPGLDPMFAQLKGMTEEQKAEFVENMKSLGANAGLMGAAPSDDFRAAPSSGGMLGGLGKIFGFADGGLVNGRHGYSTDGAVDDQAIANLVTGEDTPPAGLGPIVERPAAPKNYFDRSANRTLQFEGGLLEADTNGTPTNFGINQASHPDIDVRKIGPDDAKAIYKNQYWDAINGDQLAAENPNLAHVAFDTAIIAGAPRAKKMLEASGGDPVKYMELRTSFLNGLVARNPEKYGPFAKSWANRNNALMADISGDSAAPSAGVAGADLPMEQDVPAATGVVPDGELVASSIAPASDPSPGVAPPPSGPTSVLERITGYKLSPEARSGLLAAGLGMMAGRSPFAAVNIGQGGLAGLQSYYGALGQGVERAKIAGELGLRQQEVDVQQEGLDIQRMTNARQIYSMILPQLRLLKDKGLPIPPEYARIINEAFPPSSEDTPPHLLEPTAGEGGLGTETGAGTTLPIGGTSGGTTPPLAQTGAGVENGTAPPVAGAVQTPPAGTSTTPPETAAPVDERPTDPAVVNMLDKLGKTSMKNPIYLYELADRASTSDDAIRYSTEARELMKDYAENGIYIDGKKQFLPGSEDMISGKSKAEKVGQLEGDLVTDFYKNATSVMDNYAIQRSGLMQAADILQDFESGALQSTAGDITSFLSSINVPVSEKRLQDASNAQIFQKVMITGLLDSDLRGKMGNVALGELQIAQKSVGNENSQPTANRSIVGTMTGMLDWKYEMARDLQRFVDSKGGLGSVTPSQMREWQAENWDKKLPEYIQTAKANNPVKGELTVVGGKLQMRDGSTPKTNYKYIMPDELTDVPKIVKWNGKQFIEVRE